MFVFGGGSRVARAVGVRSVRAAVLAEPRLVVPRLYGPTAGHLDNDHWRGPSAPLHSLWMIPSLWTAQGDVRTVNIWADPEEEDEQSLQLDAQPQPDMEMTSLKRKRVLKMKKHKRKKRLKKLRKTTKQNRKKK